MPSENLIQDLPTQSPAYAAHAKEIAEIRSGMHSNREEIQHALDLIEEEKGKQGMEARTRSSKKTNMLGSIFKEDRVYCELAQRVYHTVARMMYDRGMMSTPVREVMMKAISVRLSILNFPVDQKVKSYVPDIEQLDHACGRAGIRSLTPYLYTPNSTLTQFKNLLQEERFAATDVIATLAQLFTDTHVLHSLCMCMANTGMPEEIAPFLKNEAKRRGTILPVLIAGEKDLAHVHLMGLVESGKCEDAAAFGKTIMPHLYASAGAAEKYAIALRATGQFSEAVSFLREAQKRGLNAHSLGVQLTMAQRGDRSVFLKKKAETA